MSQKKMIDNLNIISRLTDYKGFKPTKRYIKLLPLLCAFSALDFADIRKILNNLYSIDLRLAKFGSISADAILNAFCGHTELIEEYRPLAELCVRTHNFATVAVRISKLPELIQKCPF